MRNHDISWDNIDILTDYMITYLLYKEGKNIDAIGRIRKITEEEVKHHLIMAKSELFIRNEMEKSILEKLLELCKSDRKNILVSMQQKEKWKLAKQIYKEYNTITNPEDKMVLIWIIGELRMKGLLPIIHQDIKHPNGNVRRMVCSAINKIGDKSSVPYLYKALIDPKPQVRQYAAKALGKIGDEKTITKMQQCLYNSKEKIYVKQSLLEAIKNIQRRLENF